MAIWQRRIEERKASREQEKKDTEEKEARRDADVRTQHATSAELLAGYRAERKKLMAEAETVVGRLRATNPRSTCCPSGSARPLRSPRRC